MEIKNGTLINMIEVLKKYEDKKLPQKITYAVMKNLQNLYKEYELYEKQLRKIFDSYSDKFLRSDAGEIIIKNNGIPQIEDEYYEEFNNEIIALLNMDATVDFYFTEPEQFDYNSDKYDVLTAKELFEITNILCCKKIEKIGDE